jgi:hypothetical protein
MIMNGCVEEWMENGWMGGSCLSRYVNGLRGEQTKPKQTYHDCVLHLNLYTDDPP